MWEQSHGLTIVILQYFLMLSVLKFDCPSVLLFNQMGKATKNSQFWDLP